MSKDKRKHVRTTFSGMVKVTQSNSNSHLLRLRDLSDGGVFLVVTTEEQLFEIEEIVEVQIQNIPAEAPILNMKIVRKAEDGYGLVIVEQAGFSHNNRQPTIWDRLAT